MAKRKNSTALFEVMRAAQQKALERQGISVQSPGASAHGSGTSASGNNSTPAAPSTSKRPASAVQKPAAPQPAAQAPADAEPVYRQPVSRSFAPPPGQSQFKPLGTPSILAVTRKWLATLTEKKARPVVEETFEETSALDANDPTAGITAQSLASRAQRPAADRPAASRPAPSAAPAEPNPEQVFVDDDADLPAVPARRPAARAALTRSTPAATVGETASRQQLAIDRDRQEVTVKVRFQTIIIGAVAALSVIGLAYIVGKKAGAPAARTPTTPEIRNGPAQPGVLDPNAPRQPTSAEDGGLASSRTSGSGVAGILPSNNSGTTVRPDALYRDASIQNEQAVREPKLNYCVIQSYSPEQGQWAREVRDYLNSLGIACTIEFGGPETRTRIGDYIIVGTRGFEPAFGKSPAYEQYMQALERAGRGFPDKSKFNVPQPMWVRWVSKTDA